MKELLKDHRAVEKIAWLWVKNRHELLFDSRAEGTGMDAASISLNRSYGDYKQFLTENKSHWGNLLSEINYVLVDLKGGVSKPFSLKYLAEDKKREKKN